MVFSRGGVVFITNRTVVTFYSVGLKLLSSKNHMFSCVFLFFFFFFFFGGGGGGVEASKYNPPSPSDFVPLKKPLVNSTFQIFLIRLW